MKIQKQITQEIEVATMALSAGVRYWEDATINGVEWLWSSGCQDTEVDSTPP